MHQNSKSEYRNAKQIRMTEIQNSKQMGLLAILMGLALMF
jgi:hypothetical protein